MKSLAIVTFGAWLVLFPQTHAQSQHWAVDASCTGNKGEFVRRGMQGAFVLAERAMTATQQAIDDPNKHNDQLALIVQLFGTTNVNDLTPSQELVRIFTNIMLWVEEGQPQDGNRDIVSILPTRSETLADTTPESLL
jgi:hypothetical protein